MSMSKQQIVGMGLGGVFLVAAGVLGYLSKGSVGLQFHKAVGTLSARTGDDAETGDFIGCNLLSQRTASGGVVNTKEGTVNQGAAFIDLRIEDDNGDAQIFCQISHCSVGTLAVRTLAGSIDDTFKLGAA